MILIAATLFFLSWGFHLFFSDLSWTEKIMSGVLTTIAILGIVPFFLREYFNIAYVDSPLYLAIVAIGFTGIGLLISKKMHSPITKNFGRQKNPVKIGIVVSVLLIFRSLILPIQGWDSYTMYDARAHMLINNETFASMERFSDYDEFNVLYYLSYPPMTSVVHAVLYGINFDSPMIIYALFFSSIIFSFLGICWLFEIKPIAQTIGLMLLILNPLLISQTNIAYTNLPMVGFQMAALFYLFHYYKHKNIRSLFFSGLFLGFGSWTRSLEPTFIGYIFALIYILVFVKNLQVWRKFLLVLMYFCLSVMWKYAWNYYISRNVGVFSAGETNPTFVELFFRLVASLSLSNLFEVVFFISNALKPISLYITAVILGVFFLYFPTVRKYVTKMEILLAVIFFTILLLMIGGTLYFSQTFVWWNQIGGSFLRSNLLLIPLSVTFSVFYLNNRWHLLFKSP